MATDFILGLSWLLGPRESTRHRYLPILSVPILSVDRSLAAHFVAAQVAMHNDSLSTTRQGLAVLRITILCIAFLLIYSAKLWVQGQGHATIVGAAV